MEFIPYKANECFEHLYYQIPMELFFNKNYKDKLNSDSKILYGFLLNRLTLSIKNNWLDEEGNVFLIFTRKEVQELLGSRMAYMVYPKGSSNPKGSYIVDCLVGDKDGDVSIKIATALCMLIPQCDYPYIGKRIECADIINVYQMPVELTNKDGYYMLSRKEDMDYNFVFEDKRYVILIRDLEEKVAIYLYKK